MLPFNLGLMVNGGQGQMLDYPCKSKAKCENNLQERAQDIVTCEIAFRNNGLDELNEH